MKQLLKPKYLPWAAFAGGLLGLGLHKLTYLLAVDGRNLLLPGHPAETALWVLSALVLGGMLLAVGGLGGKGTFEVNFPGSLWGAAGHFVFAAGILMTVLFQAPAMGGGLGLVWRGLGLLAFPMLLWAGADRMAGKQPHFAAHMALCAFLTIHIVTHYRTWSSDPQLLDYVFNLLGSIAMLLFAYYQTAFDVGFSRRRRLMAAGLASIYLATAGLGDTPYRLLYLCGMAWVATNFCAWEIPGESVEG